MPSFTISLNESFVPSKSDSKKQSLEEALREERNAVISNFQKFSGISRFKSDYKERLYNYTPLPRANLLKAKSREMMRRNMQLTQYKPENAIKNRESKIFHQKFKSETTQLTKEGTY